MDPIATFSGLASGVQWRDLIDQLMEIEERPAQLLQQKISGIQTRSAAWLSFQSKLTTFQDAASALADGSSFDGITTTVTGSGFTASASASASPGSYSVEVLRVATAEKLGSDVVASSADSLGLSGEFWINGAHIAVDASDTLDDLAYTINAADTGVNATGVSATVVSTDAGDQLILSARSTGATGIALADGADGIATALGLTDGTTTLKHATSDGATSDVFHSASTAVSTLLGITGTTSGVVDIGGVQDVTIDLTGGLDDIAQAINDAATAQGKQVSAAVVSETVDDEVVYRLDISGTTAFTDANGVLETLGVLEAGRSAVAQSIRSSTAFEDGLGAAATAATELTALATDAGTAGVQVGDTLTLAGTRRDGTTFQFDYTVQGGDTLQSVLDALEGASGYDGAAAASIDGNGQLVVTDGTAGSSLLDLSIISHNEGGGTLDFRSFETSVVGRSREIVAGTDAAVRVDGNYSTYSSNTITGPVPGVTLTVTGTTTEAATLTLARDVDAAVDGVKALVDGYNGVAEFVTDQFTGGEGSTKPLAADSSLRSFRARMLSAMQTALGTGAAGSWTRLTDVGVEIQKDGTFAFDETTLRDALAADPTAVERLFGVHGAASGSGVRYLSAGDQTASGTYTVGVTSAATTAAVTGSTSLSDGLGSTFVSDTLVITDLGSGDTYSVGLEADQSADTVLSNVQTELATAHAHALATTTALETDAGGTAATTDTTWSEVYQSGSSAAVQDGDTITVTGRRADGTSFTEYLAIADASTQTLGELEDLVQNALGTDATVELGTDGRFTVTAADTGSSLLELEMSSDNLGGGTLQLTTGVTQEGRSAAAIDASLAGGALQLVHRDYGSNAGFRIEYANAGTETELGLGGTTATEYTGTDVVGTIGGLAATGSGRVLTGDAGTDVDGLTVSVDDSFTDGSVTFSRGIAAIVEQTVEPMLGTDDGSIQWLIDNLDERVETLNDRIADIQARLERREESLVRQFTAMEQAMAVAQNQSAWLTSQISSLVGSSSSTDG
jgi:flagellar hook-associated protein 2